MGFPVYDFRNPDNITNMLVTPQIRSRSCAWNQALQLKDTLMIWVRKYS